MYIIILYVPVNQSWPDTLAMGCSTRRIKLMLDVLQGKSTFLKPFYKVQYYSFQLNFFIFQLFMLLPILKREFLKVSLFFKKGSYLSPATYLLIPLPQDQPSSTFSPFFFVVLTYKYINNMIILLLLDVFAIRYYLLISHFCRMIFSISLQPRLSSSFRTSGLSTLFHWSMVLQALCQQPKSPPSLYFSRVTWLLLVLCSYVQLLSNFM